LLSTLATDEIMPNGKLPSQGEIGMATAVRKPSLALVIAALLLAGCASTGRYPSLAVRDAERATGTMQPAEPEPYVPPATPPETLDRINRLTADAQATHQAFLAAVEKGRGTIAAGRGGAEGSDARSRAEIALADLAASRSQTMIALAELDRLYVDAELAGGELERIAAARDEVNTLVESESQTIDGLRDGR
jgi:hypothetical protein